MPEKALGHGYEVYVRQLYGEDEVGRVTWRLRRESGGERPKEGRAGKAR
jgi:hypothetical protein